MHVRVKHVRHVKRKKKNVFAVLRLNIILEREALLPAQVRYGTKSLAASAFPCHSA